MWSRRRLVELPVRGPSGGRDGVRPDPGRRPARAGRPGRVRRGSRVPAGAFPRPHGDGPRGGGGGDAQGPLARRHGGRAPARWRSARWPGLGNPRRAGALRRRPGPSVPAAAGGRRLRDGRVRARRVLRGRRNPGNGRRAALREAAGRRGGDELAGRSAGRGAAAGQVAAGGGRLQELASGPGARRGAPGGLLRAGERGQGRGSDGRRPALSSLRSRLQHEPPAAHPLARVRPGRVGGLSSTPRVRPASRAAASPRR